VADDEQVESLLCRCVRECGGGFLVEQLARRVQLGWELGEQLGESRSRGLGLIEQGRFEVGRRVHDVGEGARIGNHQYVEAGLAPAR